MVRMTVLSLSSSSPRAISSVFIHRIILQRDSGRPAAQPTDTFAAGRDSLPAFPEALQRAEDGEEDGRGGQLPRQTQLGSSGGRGRQISPECDATAAVSYDSWRLEGRILYNCCAAWQKWRLSSVEWCCRGRWRDDADETAPTVTAAEALMDPLHMKAEHWRGGDEAAGSLIRTFMLRHQHTWWCEPVWTWQTERGRGRQGQRCGFHTAASNPRLTSSVERRHSSHNIGEPTPQTRLVTDLAGWSRCGHFSATVVCCCAPDNNNNNNKCIWADAIPACVKAP